MPNVKEKVTRAPNALVTLKKMAEKDALPAQALAILGALEAKGGKLTIEELKRSMQGRVKSKQSMSAIWSFYHARLVKAGCIRVA